MAFNFSSKWINGSINDAPDALSRDPVSDSINKDNLAEYDYHIRPENLIAEIHTVTSNQHHNLNNDRCLSTFCTRTTESTVL